MSTLTTPPLKNYHTLICILLRAYPGANLINIQRLGLRLRLKKPLPALRLTVIFESYKHDIEA